MTARLDADATRALEAARTLARRYQHAEVTLEHLLRALLGEQDAMPSLAQAVSRPELVARLDARLTARARCALYRDSPQTAVPVLSLAVERTLRRASGGGLLWFLNEITRRALVSAVVTEGAVVMLLAEARFDDRELADVLVEAEDLAAVRQHDLVTVNHVLLVLLDSRWLAGAIDQVGGSAAELRACLEKRLSLRPLVGIEEPVRQSQAVADFAATAKVRARLSGEETTFGRHFVIALLAVPRLAPVLVDASIPPLALLRYFATGYVDAGEDAPSSGSVVAAGATEVAVPEGDLEVIFHNDEVSTMEFVVEVLVRCFDLAASDAMERMLDVHQGGQRRVARFAAAEARARVGKARAMAERAQMPLRISLRAGV